MSIMAHTDVADAASVATADATSDASVDAASNVTIDATDTDVVGISSYGAATNVVGICSIVDTTIPITRSAK
jgi:hypothetical protein